MAWNKETMKKVGIGCLIVLAVLAVIGVIGGLKLRSAIKEAGGWEPFVRKKSAEYMRLAVNEAVTILPLNTMEKQTIIEPVAKLSERMSKGEVTPEQSQLIVEACYRSRLPEALLALVFQRKYVKDNQEEAKLTVNRFVKGILTGKITGDDTGRFTVLMLAEPRALELMRQPDRKEQAPAQGLKLKEEISPEDIAKALELMKAAADKAGMPFLRSDLNFTPMIDDALRQALTPVKK